MADIVLLFVLKGRDCMSAIQSKERYDSKYEHITSTGYQLMNYDPGSVFKLNGKEYVL